MNFHKIGTFTYLTKSSFSQIFKRNRSSLVFVCHYYSKTKFVRLPRITNEEPLMALVLRNNQKTFTLRVLSDDKPLKIFIGNTDVTSALFGSTRIPPSTPISHMFDSDQHQIGHLRALWLERHSPKTLWRCQENGLPDMFQDSGTKDHRLDCPTLEVQPPQLIQKCEETNPPIDTRPTVCIPPPAEYHPHLPNIVSNWNYVVDELLSEFPGHAEKYNQLYRRVVLKRAGLPHSTELKNLFNTELQSIASECSYSSFDKRTPLDIIRNSPMDRQMSDRIQSLTGSITKTLQSDIQQCLEDIAKEHMRSLSLKIFDVQDDITSLIKSETRRLQKAIFDGL